MSCARVLVLVACAALLAFATALPAAAAQQNARSGHSLVKKLPKKWVQAYKLKGNSARPLADPDRDGACNWVEFRQRTNPRKGNQVVTTPPATGVPASRIILLHGIVVESTATTVTLQLHAGLLVDVAIAATTPIVDGQGLTTALAPGQSVHAFVSQTSNRALSAVLVLVDDEPAEDEDEDEDEWDEDDWDEDDDDDHHKGGRDGKR